VVGLTSYTQGPPESHAEEGKKGMGKTEKIDRTDGIDSGELPQVHDSVCAVSGYVWERAVVEGRGKAGYGGRSSGAPETGQPGGMGSHRLLLNDEPSSTRQ